MIGSLSRMNKGAIVAFVMEINKVLLRKKFGRKSKSGVETRYAQNLSRCKDPPAVRQ